MVSCFFLFMVSSIDIMFYADPPNVPGVTNGDKEPLQIIAQDVAKSMSIPVHYYGEAIQAWIEKDFIKSAENKGTYLDSQGRQIFFHNTPLNEPSDLCIAFSYTSLFSQSARQDQGKCKDYYYITFKFGDISGDNIFTAKQDFNSGSGHGGIIVPNHIRNPLDRETKNFFQKANGDIIVCLAFSLGCGVNPKDIDEFLIKNENVSVVGNKCEYTPHDGLFKFEREQFENLFPHCSVIVTSGGQGSMTKAFWAKKPQLICYKKDETGRDKARNFRTIQKMAVSPTYESPNCIDDVNFQETLKEIVKNPIYASKASEVNVIDSGLENASRFVQEVERMAKAGKLTKDIPKSWFDNACVNGFMKKACLYIDEEGEMKTCGAGSVFQEGECTIQNAEKIQIQHRK